MRTALLTVWITMYDASACDQELHSRDWSLAPNSAATQKYCFLVKETSLVQSRSYVGKAGDLKCSESCRTRAS